MAAIEQGNDYVLIRNGGGVALVVGNVNNFPTVGIPNGTLGYDPSSTSWYSYRTSSAAWGLASPTLSALTAAGGFTGPVTGDVTGSVTGSASIDYPNAGTYEQAFSNGASLITGVIDELTTLSKVALTTNGATQIPAGSRVLAVLARVTEVIDTATAIEIGITAVDTDGYVPSMAVAAGTTSIAQGALVGLANPRAAATTYTILANGQPAATGKVRVQILYETLTAPTS